MVSLFDGISIIVVYLIPKPSFRKTILILFLPITRGIREIYLSQGY